MAAPRHGGGFWQVVAVGGCAAWVLQGVCEGPSDCWVGVLSLAGVALIKTGEEFSTLQSFSSLAATAGSLHRAGRAAGRAEHRGQGPDGGYRWRCSAV